jgi:hypothetical protein
VFKRFRKEELLKFCFKEVTFGSLNFLNTLLYCSIVVSL